MRTRLNIEPYSPPNPTKVAFIFIGPNSLSRVEDLAAVNHVTQDVVKIGALSRVQGITARAKVFKSRAQIEFSMVPLRNKHCHIYIYMDGHLKLRFTFPLK